MPDRVKLTDWTCDSRGTSNSSPLFCKLCDEVDRLIRDDARALLSGNAGSTARLIMAQLAHVHNLAPVTNDAPPQAFTASELADELELFAPSIKDQPSLASVQRTISDLRNTAKVSPHAG